MDNKMFKRTLLGAAVASLSFAGAVQAKPATDTVDLYGQVALSIWQYGEGKLGGGDAPITFENESRFGLRGTADLARGPKLFWQMEGGNVGDAGGNSGLGVRDTFLGFDFEDAGRVRVGRMLTPTYEIIDWPYSGQRAGAIFDWGGDVVGGARYTRQSNMIRYDSANLGGFTFNLAAGRGTESNVDSNFASVGAHFTKGVFTVHGGYEIGKDRDVGTLNALYNRWALQNPGENVIGDDIGATALSDTKAGIIGVELHFDTFGVNAAVKSEGAKYDNVKIDDVARPDLTGTKIDQNSYSLGFYYSGVESWNFKLNYAANLDAELDGAEVADSADSIFSAQAMYFFDDSALGYVRPYVIEKDGSSSEFGWGVGVEYFF